MHEPTTLPSTPAATIPNIVRLPSLTLNPANSMIASLGIGMQALSSVIRTNTPPSPAESMKSVATLTIESRMEASMGVPAPACAATVCRTRLPAG